MATTDNTHPMSGFSTSLSSFITLIKGNPIFSFFAGLVLLGLVLPPRARKQKRKKVTRRKKTRKYRTDNTVTPGASFPRRRKTKKTKKLPRSVNVPGKKTKSPGRTMPARFKDAKKGTPLMAEKMNWLRGLR